MRVTVIGKGEQHQGIRLGAADAAMPSSYGGWRPRCVLGADSPGGLILPPAQPTAAWLYGPRGVWTDGRLVVVADTGNHRVLIWNELPTHDGAAADVVLGQPNEHCEGPAAGGRGPDGGMHLPTGVLVDQGRLVVADAWHHRLLVWDQIPTVGDTRPDRVLFQPDFESVEPNGGGEASAATAYWPFGLAIVEGRLVVADTGNRRVLIFNDGIPEPGQPADIVLGQPNEHAREENRGGPVAADSFRWPHAVVPGPQGGLLVADAGNHRVLRWDQFPTHDCPADAVLGQPDLEQGTEFPYVSQVGKLRFPYGMTHLDDQLVVADTANNRVLIYPTSDVDYDAAPLAVLGQRDAGANGENRWESVSADSMCWPYGVHAARSPEGSGLIAIADSGNNRVVVWEQP